MGCLIQVTPDETPHCRAPFRCSGSRELLGDATDPGGARSHLASLASSPRRWGQSGEQVGVSPERAWLSFASWHQTQPPAGPKSWQKTTVRKT